MLATAALGAGLGLSGFLIADAGLGAVLIKSKEPDFQFISGKEGVNRIYVVFDGFVGHPQYRFEHLMDVFGGHSVLFVNPNGDRFKMNQIVRHTVRKLRKLGAMEVVPVGGSLGAKAAYKLTAVLRSSVYPRVRELKFIDPLHDGSGVKLPAATVIYWTQWHPGPMQNFLLHRVIGPQVVGQNPTNKHREYGYYHVKASRVADEAREAKSGPLGLAIGSVDVTIIRCQPEDDEVLRSNQVEAWMREFPGARLITVQGQTHHMGLDTEPEVWREDLTAGLALKPVAA